MPPSSPRSPRSLASRYRSLRRLAQLGPAGTGTDLATLFLAVPVLAVGLWTASRGSSAGRLAVVAGLLYLVYNYAIFAFSVAMNPLTAVHIAIFGLALWSLLLAGRAAVDGAEDVTERLNRRAAGGLLIGVGAMFGLLWLGQIATVATTGVLPPDLVKAGISSNPVYALDLAFFLPLCAIAGIGLLRRNSAAAFAFPMLDVGPPDGRGRRGRHPPHGGGRRSDAVPVAVVITVLGVASSILARGARPTEIHRSAPAGPPAIPSDAFWRRRSVVVRVGWGPTIARRTIP